MKAIYLAYPLILIIFMIGCQNNKNQTKTKSNSISNVAWDTLKIKAAVNNYLKAHEKYFNLIDSISYDPIDTLRTMWILYDQSSYFTSIANTMFSKNPPKQIIVPPGQPIPKQAPYTTPYSDSAKFYLEQGNQAREDHTIKGFRVYVTYRLSDVMLTYSDFTSLILYLDTAYHVIPKRKFLHYTNIPLEPPTQAGFYFDSIYLYTPSKE